VVNTVLCDHVVEVFDGAADVTIRLNIQPERFGKARTRTDRRPSGWKFYRSADNAGRAI
jgi:hypothetical protein